MAALLQEAGRNDDWVVRPFRIGGRAGRAPDVAVLAGAHIPGASYEVADRLDAWLQGVARGDPAILIEGSRHDACSTLPHWGTC